jgi:hypothetical protein
MHTLLQFKESNVIEGVLYTHDDSLLNLTVLSQGTFPFPTQSIIGNDLGKGPAEMSYKDPRVDPDGLASKYAYRIYPNGTFANHNATKLVNSQLDLGLVPWGMRDRSFCAPGQRQLAMDPESEKYREPDGAILFPPFTQADFLYVPTNLADEYAEISKLVLKYNIWIECGFGTIVDQLRERTNATVRIVPLCTSWGPQRGKVPMLSRCIHQRGPKARKHYGIFHPFKMGSNVQGFNDAFDGFYAGSL